MESAPTGVVDGYRRGAFYTRPRADSSIRPYRVGYNRIRNVGGYSFFFFFNTTRYTAYTTNADKLTVVPVRRPGVW